MRTTERAEDLITRRLEESGKALEALRSMHADLAAALALLQRTVASKGKVLTCGNGGSAAEAMHLAEELVGRYRSNRQPIPAICLNSDPTALTCIANDFGFEEVFARQVHAHGAHGDLLIVFSTSGKRPNIFRALEEGRARGVTTLALLGGDGGAAATACDRAIVVRGVDGAAVQEAHQVILHLLCESLEPS